MDVLTYYFAIFLPKLHENGKKIGPRGDRVPGVPSLNPPMICLRINPGILPKDVYQYVGIKRTRNLTNKFFGIPIIDAQPWCDRFPDFLQNYSEHQVL